MFYFEQTMILEGALELHGKIAPSANQPLHRRLVEVSCVQWLYCNKVDLGCNFVIIIVFLSVTYACT